MALSVGRHSPPWVELSAQGQTTVMAILNVTPDSFSDGGALASLGAIVARASEALNAGAHILDIGGESTRPGAAEVPVDVEIQRVIPAVQAILTEYPQAFISIDTRKAPVAEAALEAGAQMINDVSGLRFNPAIAPLIAKTGASLCLMHSQGTPETMQNNPSYIKGVLPEIRNFFQRQLKVAEEAGIKRSQVVLDPGFGFGKTLDHNLEILKHLSEFQSQGCPLLVGTSRKSFLTLGDSDISPVERDALTAASLALATQADIVRIHNPRMLVPVVRFLDRFRQIP